MHYGRKDLLRIVALAVAYALLHLLSLKISSVNGIGNLIWLPSGIAIASLLLYGIRLWPGIFLGAYIGATLAGDPRLTCFVAALGNTLDPMVGAFLLTRVVRDFNVGLSRQRDLMLLVLCGGVVGPLLDGILVLPFYLPFGSVPPMEFLRQLIHWWMTTFIGVVMVAPLLLMLLARPGSGILILQRPLEAAVLAMCTLLTNWASWSVWGNLFQSQAGILMLIPFFIWAAARLGQIGTALLATLVYGMDLALVHQLAGNVSGYVANGWDFWLIGIVMTLCGQFVAVMFHERDVALKAARESEEWHRLSQYYGGIGAWESDLVNREQIWSENCSQILGFPALAKPAWENFLETVHPDDRQKVIAATRDHLESNAVYDVQYRIVTRDGPVRWMRSAGQVERDARGKPVRMRGIVQDTTTREQLAQLLVESESRYRAMLQDAGDAILIADMNGKLEEINRAGERLLGYSRDEILEMNVSQIHPADVMDEVLRHFENIAENGSMEPVETRILRKDGKEVDVEIRPTLIEINGRKVVQGIFIDLTERKRQERDRAAEEAAQRDMLVREVHHRIKNNLQGITGVLRQYAEDHPQLRPPLYEAIGQMQGLSVVYGLQGNTSQQSPQLGDLVSSIAGGVGRLWQVEVETTIPDSGCLCLIAENEMVPLALVINELLSNAVKHGGTGLKVRVEIVRKVLPDRMVLTISNEGRLPPGLTLESLPEGGSGLSLVKSLLPPRGVRLLWQQTGATVMTSLELSPPVIFLEPNP